MKYLVTGGCGFIGRHLVRALARTGSQVVVLDVVTAPFEDDISSSLTILRGSVTDRNAVARAMADCDGIFHLAAISSIDQCERFPAECENVNVNGTQVLFAEAHRLGGIPIVYASSAAIYGDTSSGVSRSGRAVHAYGLYAQSKLATELRAQHGGKVLGVPNIGLRLFNIFGPNLPGRKPRSVISRLISQNSNAIPMTILGSGLQVRDFVFVDDVVRYLTMALNLADRTSPLLDVCTGVGTSVLDVARMISQISGRELLVEYYPPAPFDIAVSVGDPNPSNAVFGLKCEIPIQMGIQALMTGPF